MIGEPVLLIRGIFRSVFNLSPIKKRTISHSDWPPDVEVRGAPARDSWPGSRYDSSYRMGLSPLPPRDHAFSTGGFL